MHWLSRSSFIVLVGLATGMAFQPVAAQESTASLTVYPTSIGLRGPQAKQQIIVTGTRDGHMVDLTRDAVFESKTPGVVAIAQGGLASAAGNGAGEIVVTADGQQATMAVRVESYDQVQPVDFYNDVIPIFTRLSCNSGPCHGKSRGQNGFALSLLGFDPPFDNEALTREGRGRRVFGADPASSLLLAKPAGTVPHGGGRRLEVGDEYYEVLHRWLAAGSPPAPANAAQLVEVTVTPNERVMSANTAQQLVVTARYSDGTIKDVTRLSAFLSNESAIAAVNADGLVTTSTVVGEAAVMARFMGEIAVCDVAVPLAEPVAKETYAALPRYNFIDEHVWTKLERLNITPSDPAPDYAFLRRAYVDVIGRLPNPDETRAFLADTATDKRVKLIDTLLERPEFGNHWANKWVDLLRPNPYRVGIKATMTFDDWIRDSFRENKPYDQFVRELITARGSTFHNGAVTLFRDRRSPDELTTIVSQLFLGIRLECAKCHHHPFEVWGQEDFYSFAAYFSRIKYKGAGLSPPISGGEEIIYSGPDGEVRHPLTQAVLPPKPLFGEARATTPEQDPREVLAEWMTSDQNVFFAQVMANRVWGDLMGRGLVEPVDDLRATNPASNQALLEALGQDFREQGFDLKKLVRRIATSYVYGLSSIANDRNLADTRNYSRYYRQRLRAEVLLDAVADITRIPEEFAAMPAGSRANEIWTHRVESLFLDAFGRPDENQDPPCERTTDTTVVQALHLMNSENLAQKITSDSGRAAQLAEGDRPVEQVIDDVYLLVYSRTPTDEERQIALGVFATPDLTRRQAVEDLLWALMNTPEFVFKN